MHKYRLNILKKRIQTLDLQEISVNKGVMKGLTLFILYIPPHITEKWSRVATGYIIPSSRRTTVPVHFNAFLELTSQQYNNSYNYYATTTASTPFIFRHAGFQSLARISVFRGNQG